MSQVKKEDPAEAKGIEGVHNEAETNDNPPNDEVRIGGADQSAAKHYAAVFRRCGCGQSNGHLAAPAVPDHLATHKNQDDAAAKANQDLREDGV